MALRGNIITDSSALIDSPYLGDILTSLAKPINTFTGEPLHNFHFERLDPDAIANRIQALRRHGYIHLAIGEPKPRNILIAQHDITSLHEYENEIQALRYLRGMIIIASHCHDATEKLSYDDIASVFNKYAQLSIPATEVHQLAEEFAYLLKNSFKISIEKARKQVTMARDLGILLEDHDDICTVSKNDDQITIEISHNLKISPAYYTDEFGIDVFNKKWFIHALKFAGFNDEEYIHPTKWLHGFFQDGAMIDELQKKGVAAPPSARWLPLPGNAQEVEVITGRLEQNKLSSTVTNRFIRLGTISVFTIDDMVEQKRLAIKILEEIIYQRINSLISQYKYKYKQLCRNAVGRVDFFVNYQTLLSPHRMEPFFYSWGHVDNNGLFVKLAKKAMNEVKERIALSSIHADVDLHFCQTNSAINALAGWVSIKEYDRDPRTRNRKLAVVAELVRCIDPYNPLIAIILGENKTPGVVEVDLQLKNLKQPLQKLVVAGDMTEETLNSILLRIRAAVHLRLLQDNKHFHKDLPVYQFNIMQASLELLTQGNQGICLVGCKSARDRTAILAAAAKTMQENPHAMGNWDYLNAGITASLAQGHHFRAMSYHVAMVKVHDVHNDFMDQLDKVTQKRINEVKIFSKTLGSIKVETKPSLRSSQALSDITELDTEKTQQPPIVSTNMIKENLAIENLQKFKIKMADYIDRMQAGPLDKKRENTKNFIVNYLNRNLLKEFSHADKRKQSFQDAWQHIAMITPRQLLADLGVDAIASVENIKHVIDTTHWNVKGLKAFVGEQPRHVKQIRDIIKVFDASKQTAANLDQYAFVVLKDILATAYTAAKINDDDLLRHRNTQRFYTNIAQHLVPKGAQLLSNR